MSIGADSDSLNAALPDHIYMDAMAFGMGCCCLQMTFQVCFQKTIKIRKKKWGGHMVLHYVSGMLY